MRAVVAVVAVVAIGVLYVASCTTSALNTPCARRSDCSSGFCSKDGYCAIAPVDAGPPPIEDETPIPPPAVCGDGTIGNNEECDDGGTTPSDGCNENCRVEAGFNCTGEPSVCSQS